MCCVIALYFVVRDQDAPRRPNLISMRIIWDGIVDIREEGWWQILVYGVPFAGDSSHAYRVIVPLAYLICNHLWPHLLNLSCCYRPWDLARRSWTSYNSSNICSATRRKVGGDFSSFLQKQNSTCHMKTLYRRTSHKTTKGSRATMTRFRIDVRSTYHFLCGGVGSRINVHCWCCRVSCEFWLHLAFGHRFILAPELWVIGPWRMNWSCTR